MQCSRAVSEVVAMKKAHFKWLPWCTRVDPYLLSCTHACESHYGLFTTPTYTYDTCQAAHIRQRGIFWNLVPRNRYPPESELATRLELSSPTSGTSNWKDKGIFIQRLRQAVCPDEQQRRESFGVYFEEELTDESETALSPDRTPIFPNMKYHRITNSRWKTRSVWPKGSSSSKDEEKDEDNTRQFQSQFIWWSVGRTFTSNGQ
jgi:hypothetical protein